MAQELPPKTNYSLNGLQQITRGNLKGGQGLVSISALHDGSPREQIRGVANPRPPTRINTENSRPVRQEISCSSVVKNRTKGMKSQILSPSLDRSFYARKLTRIEGDERIGNDMKRRIYKMKQNSMFFGEVEFAQEQLRLKSELLEKPQKQGKVASLGSEDRSCAQQKVTILNKVGQSLKKSATGLYHKLITNTFQSLEKLNSRLHVLHKDSNHRNLKKSASVDFHSHVKWGKGSSGNLSKESLAGEDTLSMPRLKPVLAGVGRTRNFRLGAPQLPSWNSSSVESSKMELLHLPKIAPPSFQKIKQVEKSDSFLRQRSIELLGQIDNIEVKLSKAALILTEADSQARSHINSLMSLNASLPQNAPNLLKRAQTPATMDFSSSPVFAHSKMDDSKLHGNLHSNVQGSTTSLLSREDPNENAHHQIGGKIRPHPFSDKVQVLFEAKPFPLIQDDRGDAIMREKMKKIYKTLRLPNPEEVYNREVGLPKISKKKHKLSRSVDQSIKKYILVPEKGKYADHLHILDSAELGQMIRLTKHHKRQHR